MNSTCCHARVSESFEPDCYDSETGMSDPGGLIYTCVECGGKSDDVCMDEEDFVIQAD